MLQKLSSDNWIHLTPGGLPFGIPGIAEDIEGASQQAPHLCLHLSVLSFKLIIGTSKPTLLL